jgi:hypothetical protein
LGLLKRTPAGQTITVRFLMNDSLRVGLRVLIAFAAANLIAFAAANE